MLMYKFWGIFLKNKYLSSSFDYFFLFFSNEVGAEAKIPGCAKEFCNAGANCLLDLTFTSSVLVFPLAVQWWN